MKEFKEWNGHPIYSQKFHIWVDDVDLAYEEAKEHGVSFDDMEYVLSAPVYPEPLTTAIFHDMAEYLDCEDAFTPPENAQEAVNLFNDAIAIWLKRPACYHPTNVFLKGEK